jgi:hypothetical protein
MGPLRTNLLAAALVSLVLACACSPPEIPAPDLFLIDLDGERVDPFAATGIVANVFLFTRTDCPIGNRYTPEVQRLEDKYRQHNIVFWLVYADPNEPIETIRRHLTDYAYDFGVLRDPHHTLVELTGAHVTPEAAVFVDATHLVYRGRIDNRYVAFGKTRAEATVHDLDQALTAILAGQPVATPETEAIGCFISPL